jgi:hypothetical protein
VKRSGACHEPQGVGVGYPRAVASGPGRGSILSIGCSDEALVAYLTLALRGLVHDVDWSTVILRRCPSFLLARKLVAEMDTRDCGDVPAEDECHCGSPFCPGCEDGRELLSRIPALDPEVRPCPECGSAHAGHRACFMRVPKAPARRLRRVLTDERIAELIERMDTDRPAGVRAELSAALRELLARRGARS